MSTITILENPFVSMWLYPTKGILHHRFHKHIWGEEFRNTLIKGAEVFESRRAYKWLSDDRENCALPRADSDWAMQEWFPRVASAGWTYWAVVLPDHVVGQMNMKRIIDCFAERGVTARAFSEPSAAMGWLEAPPPKLAVAGRSR